MVSAVIEMITQLPPVDAMHMEAVCQRLRDHGCAIQPPIIGEIRRWRLVSQ